MRLWDGVLWLHLVAMAFFVGGQIVLAAAIVPVLRDRDGGEPLRAVARRFGWGTLVAILVLLATGAALATHERLWGDPTLHAKLALVVVVAALVLWHMARPRNHVLDALIFLGSLAIVWLGVVLAG